MKKIVKRCLIGFVIVIVFSVTLCGSFVAINYLKFQKIPLNVDSITNPSLAVEIYDFENRPIKEENQFNGDFVSLENLNEHTKQAFISVEDKDFFKHNGINKKRIVKAMINNIKSGRLKEGASTISQQLVKNTHLSNEKTFERKLKEIALTRKLEKAFSKNDILESYLNIIYFGNNCYGIESAANYYFNKSAKDLNLNESCTLAGMIKSASRYSPINHYENAIKRRNLVLSEMEKDGKISVEEKINTQNQPIVLDINKKSHNRLNSYSQASLDEASKILNMPTKKIALNGYKIHTYQNKEKQSILTDILSKNKLDNIDNAGIVIDSKTNGVVAFSGNSKFKILDAKRQPASCLKPILVYAPALNEGVISPSTQILDEKIQIGDYSPTNVNKNYSGYVSVTDAVKDSINIPAIKVLSYIGIDTGKHYAEKLGINFDKSDDSYALALGGMSYGVNLKELTSAYTVFPNKGEYAPSSFIQYITDKNNKLVYIHKNSPQMVFREDSSYLMTNILQETAKNGTARKLSEIKHTEIASKTGTVGKKNQKGNTDAYNISYTPEEVIGIWYGDLSNTPFSVAGGNQPTQVAKEYISSQSYQKNTFDIPSSVTTVDIDAIEKEQNHRLVLASPYAPERYVEKCLFSRFNTPSEVSQNFLEKPAIEAICEVENNQIVLEVNAQKHINYKIFKDNVPYQTIKDRQGNTKIRINFAENDSLIKILAQYGENNDLTSEKTFKMTKTSNKKTTSKEKWYI
ncbi:MAG: penicillin-binding protein [Clostridiales bacterium]|nr:penicillin-binding protein [Clostridiales bacterium]